MRLIKGSFWAYVKSANISSINTSLAGEPMVVQILAGYMELCDFKRDPDQYSYEKLYLYFSREWGGAEV